MNINTKKIFDSAKTFASSYQSNIDSASGVLAGFGLKPNCKNVTECDNMISECMKNKDVISNVEKAIYSSYDDKHSNESLELALVGGNFIDTKNNDKLKPTLVLSPRQCVEMSSTVYGNLDKPKAQVHTYGNAGVSLKAFVKPVREKVQGFKRQVIARLISEMKKQYILACGLKRETDTSNAAITKSIKSAVKTIKTKLTALKDDKAVDIINSLPKKYLS